MVELTMSNDGMPDPLPELSSASWASLLAILTASSMPFSLSLSEE